MRNARHQDDPRPLDEHCACHACTGFGRAYRELLAGEWGVVDVEDLNVLAEHLFEEVQPIE